MLLSCQICINACSFSRCHNLPGEKQIDALCYSGYAHLSGNECESFISLCHPGMIGLLLMVTMLLYYCRNGSLLEDDKNITVSPR